MTDEPRVRCSDAEREQAARTLQEAVAAGRLDLAELDERAAAAYAARYRDDLDAALAELPLPRPEPAPTGWKPVLAMAGHQLATDVALVIGRGAALTSARRRLVTLLILTLAIAVVLMLALHGFVGEQHEHRPH